MSDRTRERPPLAVPTGEPNELYIPSIGKTFEMMQLASFTESIQLDAEGHGELKVEFDTSINLIGAYVTDENYAVYQDKCAMDARADDSSPHPSLIWQLNKGILGGFFSLFHLRYFWPQLHEMAVPQQLRANETIRFTCAPHTVVTFGGVQRRPLPK